jgi:hypothetical protein
MALRQAVFEILKSVSIQGQGVKFPVDPDSFVVQFRVESECFECKRVCCTNNATARFFSEYLRIDVLSKFEWYFEENGFVGNCIWGR